MKSINRYLIFLMFISLTSQVYAFDVLRIIPQMFTKNSANRSYTGTAMESMSATHKSIGGFNIFYELLFLPFGLLSENNQQELIINKELLQDYGYNENEIIEFESNLVTIFQEYTKAVEQNKSESEIKEIMNDLKLGVVIRELLLMKSL